MQAALRRTEPIPVVAHRANVVNSTVPVRKTLALAPSRGRHTEQEEPEALVAALSLGAIILALLVSIAIKLFILL